MPQIIDPLRFLQAAQADAELRHKLRGMTATIGFGLEVQSFALRIEAGQIVAVTEFGQAAPDVTLAGPADAWRSACTQVPPPGLDNLTSAVLKGIKVEGGSFPDLVAPYQGALQRLFVVLRECASGSTLRPPGADIDPYRETDNAVGRYVRVNLGGAEGRVYYEEAGTGPVPLVLQHTAGADSRQYRHVLANPAMQKRFRMIAWDLPYHGRSLPPNGVRWWEQDYRPGKQELLDWSAAISAAIGLDRPIYMGCSVGGQLALDLAAHKAEHFRAFISLNGWYELVSRGHHDNDIHRSPRTSTDYFASRILSATAPVAPEALAQEVYWVYRSNFPGVYAGDNDYFMRLHDLRENGHLIDPSKTPVYVLVGAYDPSAWSPQHGGQAVARHVPGVVYRELPGLGHFAPSDDPIRFCDTIVPILDEIVAQCR